MNATLPQDVVRHPRVTAWGSNIPSVIWSAEHVRAEFESSCNCLARIKACGYVAIGPLGSYL